MIALGCKLCAVECNGCSTVYTHATPNDVVGVKAFTLVNARELLSKAITHTEGSKQVRNRPPPRTA